MTSLAEVKVYLLALLAGVLLLGMAVGSSALAGFFVGRWWGEWELNYLMDIPQGGVVLSHRTGAYWVKLNNNVLRFVRLPDPRQARIVTRRDDNGDSGSNTDVGG